MDELIIERIEEVKEDLELQAGYKLSDKQMDELRLTGRVCIGMVEFAPYIKKAATFLRLCREGPNDEVNWSLSLNTISGDFELTLKGCHMSF